MRKSISLLTTTALVLIVCFGSTPSCGDDDSSNNTNVADSGPIAPANTPITPPPTVDGGGTVAVKDMIEPTVISTNPSDHFQGVAPSSSITVSFSEPIDPITVTSETIRVKDSNSTLVTGTLTYDDASRSSIFVPSANLLDSEEYTLLITTGIRDLSGNAKLNEDMRTFKVSSLKTTAVAVGGFHMLALKENKTVWAWGRNHLGQLGDGTTLDRNHPVRVQGLSDVTMLVTNNNNSYALSNGVVWAWGANEFGQIGDGTKVTRATPFLVPNLENVTAIAAGSGTGYALKADGTVWAWGSNRRGALGDGKGTGDNSTFDSAIPVQVLIDLPVIQLSVAGFAMALTQDPTSKETSIWSWGSGSFGQMGNNTKLLTVPKPVQALDPTGMSALHGITAISTGGGYATALTTAGDALLWGLNASGQLGDGSTTDRALPVKLTGLGKVIRLSGGAGAQSAFAVTEDGQLWAWGKNAGAQLLFYSANGMEVLPKAVGMISQVLDAQASGTTSAILFKDGTIKTTGLNAHGQLGHGTASYYSYSPNPTVLPAAAHVSGRLVSAKNGTVWAMGRNKDCELGLPQHGSEVMAQLQLAIPAKIIQVANSGVHMLALDENKNVWAWGSNAHGQLGNGTVGGNSCVPQKVKSPDGSGYLDNIESIAAGVPIEINTSNMFGTSMAIRKIPGDPNGATEVLAWGNNNLEQLGVAASLKNSPLPLKVNNLPANVTQVAVTEHAMAVTADGKLYGWGAGYVGQLCNGNSSGGAKPQLSAITNAKQVATGVVYSLVLLNDGTIKSCGNNFRGQLGVGWASVLSGDQTRNIQTVLGITNATFVAAAGYTSMAITADKQLWGWGNNLWGQLGTGNSINQNVPAKVLMRNGEPFSEVVEVSLYAADNTADNTTVVTAIRSDGTVWDWGYLQTPFTFLIREGESAISATQTVNWP